MHYFRYKIASSLGAILLFAVGFAALREADELWDSWLFYLTLGLLLVAVLLAALRTGDRRAFWIGFALFGWGYLSLSLKPSAEPRSIVTEALADLHQSNIFSIRAYRVRAMLDLDRMSAHNLSSDDVMEALRFSRMLPPNYVRSEDPMEPVIDKRVSPAQPGQATGQASQTVEHVLSWGARYYNPEGYGDIVLKATPDGELLRLKDVAKVDRGSSIYVRRDWHGTHIEFFNIGHTLFALLAAWLGGVLSRRFRRVAVMPEVPTEGE